MVLRLYFDLMSQPSRALFMFMRINSIPCQEIPVALRKGEHLKEEFAAINPFKRVPIIDHDGFKLSESVAIFQYLCRTQPVPAHWYPLQDIKKMARVDEYMSWQHLTLRVQGSMLFQQRFVIPRLTGQPENAKSVARFKEGLEEVLDQFENIWMRNKWVAGGEDISVADLLAVTELEQPGMAGFDVRKDHPKLSAYMDQVRERLQPHYDEAHAIAHKQKNKALAEARLN